MEEARKDKYCKGFTDAVCHDAGGKEDHFKANPKTRAAIKQFQKEEKIRRVTRHYNSAKRDIWRLERGEKPLKEFVSREDLSFWKKDQ